MAALATNAPVSMVSAQTPELRPRPRCRTSHAPASWTRRATNYDWCPGRWGRCPESLSSKWHLSGQTNPW